MKQDDCACLSQRGMFHGTDWREEYPTSHSKYHPEWIQTRSLKLLRLAMLYTMTSFFTHNSNKNIKMIVFCLTSAPYQRKKKEEKSGAIFTVDVCVWVKHKKSWEFIWPQTGVHLPPHGIKGSVMWTAIRQLMILPKLRGVSCFGRHGGLLVSPQSVPKIRLTFMLKHRFSTHWNIWGVEALHFAAQHRPSTKYNSFFLDVV